MNDSYYSMFDKVSLSEDKMQEILLLDKESKYSHKRYSIRSLYVVPAACVAIVLLLFIGPTRVYAEKVFRELVGFVSVNKENVNLGTSEWLNITMPDDMESLEYEGTQYQYKSYPDMQKLEQDLKVDLLDLGTDYEVDDSQICFQVEGKKAGSINMVIKQEENSKKILPLFYTLYFSTSKDVQTGHLTFKDLNSRYCAYDVNDHDTIIDTSRTYDIIETYKSAKLDTKVLILADKTNRSDDNGDSYHNTGYHVIFVYQHVEYHLYYEAKVNDIKDMIEQMK